MEEQCSTNRIRELRQARGMTQEDLAALVGEETSIATVSRLESGRMTLTLPWMERISAALGVTPHEIIAKGRGLRMVPVVDMGLLFSWEKELRKSTDFIPALAGVGGLRCFAVRPQAGHIDLLTRYEGTYAIIDPDQRSLELDRVYLVRMEDGGHSFHRYISDPPRLESVGSTPERKEIHIGEEPFTIVGRITHLGADF